MNEIVSSNNELIIDWLQHFMKNVKNKQIVKWIFLICDKFKSYIIYCFFQLIIDNKIILLLQFYQEKEIMLNRF